MWAPIREKDILAALCLLSTSCKHHLLITNIDEVNGTAPVCSMWATKSSAIFSTHETIKDALIFKMQKLLTNSSEVRWATTFWLNWTLLRRPSASTWSKWLLRKQPIKHTTNNHSEVRNSLAPLFQAGSHIEPEINKLSDANKSFTSKQKCQDGRRFLP